MSTIALISVAGGKFHRPAAPPGAPWFRPIQTACGCEVMPLNYYATEADANDYTGGRLARFLCKHCEPKPLLKECTDETRTTRTGH